MDELKQRISSHLEDAWVNSSFDFDRGTSINEYWIVQWDSYRRDLVAKDQYMEVPWSLVKEYLLENVPTLLTHPDLSTRKIGQIVRDYLQGVGNPNGKWLD